MRAQTAILRPEIPAGTRLIAVSDVHSHASYLRALLNKVCFSDTDKLIFVGDAVGRGPENLNTIELIMELVEADRAYAVAGNWELFLFGLITDVSGEKDAVLLDRTRYELERYGSSLFSDMCQRLDLSLNSLDDLQAARPIVLRAFKRLINFVDNLPSIIETPELIFVHGGIPTEDTDSLVNSNPYVFAKNDAFIDKAPSFRRWVIVGHWPTNLYDSRVFCWNPYISQSKHVIDIDGGVGLNIMAQLNALIIPDPHAPAFNFECYDELPVKTVLDAQQPSENSINVRWTDEGVRLLSIDDDMAFVRDVTTGHEFWALKSSLFSRAKLEVGGLYKIDGTDYRIGVSPGDSVSLVKTTSRGSLVKRNGLTGWYYGRFA